MDDVTFCIPYKPDSAERSWNYDRVTKYLIDLGYQLKVRVHTDNTVFHRTKLLNDMFREVSTPIAVIMDCDVIIPNHQLEQAAALIRDAHCTLSYPYSGEFLDIPIEHRYTPISELGAVASTHLSPAKNSVGGCVFLHKERYRQCGWENEHMIDWGYEDLERYWRVEQLDGIIKRVNGPLFHYTHPRNVTDKNSKEYQRIKHMSKGALHAEVSTWEWTR